MTISMVKGINLSRSEAWRVKKWGTIKKGAEEFLKFLDEKQGNFEGEFKDCYALHHCQVQEQDPYNYFVVSTNVYGKGKNHFISRVIINPEILESPKEIEEILPEKSFNKRADGKIGIEFKGKKMKLKNVIEVKEACMSFPLKKEKLMKRYFKIKVRYQVPGFFGLKTKEEWIEGLRAHIFQHEVQHSLGQNMHYES